jgi:hypothetical protein
VSKCSLIYSFVTNKKEERMDYRKRKEHGKKIA